MDEESKRVQLAYNARDDKGWSQRYSCYQKGTLYIAQERERVLLSMLEKMSGDLSDKKILDIGCGRGGTLIPFLAYGIKPENCYGVDILPDRIEYAKKTFPNMSFICCSAENIPFENNSFDLAMMYTCLSSVLDCDIRKTICYEAFEMLRPGGWVLIYDFKVNNPFNEDVKAVTLKELKNYFSGCYCYSKTLTLIPPFARLIGKHSTLLCSILSAIPFLRTHRITAFQKAV